jgi:RND family efflux transporter MFP subunit
MDTVVSAQGTLIPAQGASARVAVVTPGRLLNVRVREGDHVSAGQVVAVIESAVQQAQATSAAAALRASRLQAEQAKQEVGATRTEHENAVKVARLDLQTAETELVKLKKGARPQEIAQADQAVNQAQATYERAVTELERVKSLYDEGIMARRQLDDAKTALAVAKSALETARQQADLVREGARREDIHSAELRVETARANLDQARHSIIEVSQKQREAQAAVESVNQKVADLTAAETAAGYAELRAPVSGIVTRRAMNPGDSADPSTPILEIADTRALDMSAGIPADEGNTIRTGMTAQVSVSGTPTHWTPATVINVGQIDPQSGLLTVRISIPNPQGTLKVGAFATANIIVRTNRSAVGVPKEAIVSKDGKPCVLVVGKDGKAHQRKVTTGVTTETLTQIITGIAPGDRVIRLGQYELTDGMKVRVQGEHDDEK